MIGVAAALAFTGCKDKDSGQPTAPANASPPAAAKPAADAPLFGNESPVIGARFERTWSNEVQIDVDTPLDDSAPMHEKTTERGRLDYEHRKVEAGNLIEARLTYQERSTPDPELAKQVLAGKEYIVSALGDGAVTTVDGKPVAPDLAAAILGDCDFIGRGDELVAALRTSTTAALPLGKRLHDGPLVDALKTAFLGGFKDESGLTGTASEPFLEVAAIDDRTVKVAFGLRVVATDEGVTTTQEVTGALTFNRRDASTAGMELDMRSTMIKAGAAANAPPIGTTVIKSRSEHRPL